jgi:hypothetical protein
MRGESGNSRFRIGFRPQLKRLIEAFRHSGSLDGFAVAFRNDSFDKAQREILRVTLRKLVTVIVSGPVTCAGGALETGRLFPGRISRTSDSNSC